MNISYDYEELIQELKEELRDGVLSQDDNIFVLREEKSFNVSISTLGKRIVMYNPIVDWFYGDEDEDDDYSLLLLVDWLIDDEIVIKRKEEYIKSKDKLTSMTVSECLKYMEERNKII